MNNKISPTVYTLYTVNLINYLHFTGTMYATKIDDRDQRMYRTQVVIICMICVCLINRIRRDNWLDRYDLILTLMLAISIYTLQGYSQVILLYIFLQLVVNLTYLVIVLNLYLRL